MIITFSNGKSSCINKILLSNILRETQLVYIQLYAMKSDRMSQFQFHLVHTSSRMLLGKAVSRTDMFPSDSWRTSNLQAFSYRNAVERQLHFKNGGKILN